MPPGPASAGVQLLRIVAAAALAAVLGWERERAGKAAGLRTHMLVGLAAALYPALGQLTLGDHPTSDPGLRADPIRVIQAVAQGVGESSCLRPGSATVAAAAVRCARGAWPARHRRRAIRHALPDRS